MCVLGNLEVKFSFRKFIIWIFISEYFELRGWMKNIIMFILELKKGYVF